MKNHWTDKKLINDFITELSEKFSPIIGVDVDVIFKFLEKDIRENPPTEDELNDLRESKDRWVAEAVLMFLDETQPIKEEFIAALDDGIW